MGSLWRSEDMSLIQIVMQKEAAHETVGLLGKTGMLSGHNGEENDKDNHTWQKKYIHEIRRLEELEAKINFFESLIGEVKDSGDENFDVEVEIKKDYEYGVDGKSYTIEDLEADFEKKQRELKLLKSGLQKLYDQKARSEELLHVIKKAGNIIQGTSHDDSEEGSNFKYVAGVIPTSDLPAFQMVLYRQTRGNLVFKDFPIDELLYDGVDKNGKTTFTKKSVYVVFLSAEKAKEKIIKHCQTASHVYEFPKNQDQTIRQEEEMTSQLESTIKESDTTFKNTLRGIVGNLDEWKKYVALEKAIYDTMNKFNYDVQNSAVAEAWVPTKKLTEISYEIAQASQLSHSQIDSHMEILNTKKKPPTYFETNKFTQVFQDMTNAYAMPTYKEINPAVITVITFPFLFAVMFGDFGHAAILFLASLAMVVFEGRIKDTMEANELLIMLFQGRYLLLLMGTFSIYTGLLYNDVFGLSLNLFESRYTFHHEVGHFNGNTYEFGVDPAWYETTNKLMYYNSLKMKMAIIFGVCHMLLGTVLKFFNFLHFKKWAFVFMEAVPEFFILGCTFGYLSFMIIYKWCIDWVGLQAVAPDILKAMTDYFLNFYGEIQHPLYAGQRPVQITLLLIAGVSIPVLLCATPIYEYLEHRRNQNKHQLLEEHKSGEGDHEEEFILQEVLIHQLIHTIEYVIGAVSNTASYLRLWALSLAHAQLSEVFFALTIKLVLTLNALLTFEGSETLVKIIDYSGIPLAIAYSVWIGLSLGVLLMMETLSAFLHTLRLHWVEFNSKYFKGEGYGFEPLDFAALLKVTFARLPDKAEQQ